MRVLCCESSGFGQVGGLEPVACICWRIRCSAVRREDAVQPRPQRATFLPPLGALGVDGGDEPLHHRQQGRHVRGLAGPGGGRLDGRLIAYRSPHGLDGGAVLR
jgi:hypothetical protein